MADTTHYWWIKDGQLGIGTLSDSDVLAAVTEVKTVKVHYSRKATAFTTDLTEVCEIPSQFHEALVARVNEKLYARQGKLNEARYWRAEWKEYLRSAMRYVNRNRDNSGYLVVPNEY